MKTLTLSLAALAALQALSFAGNSYQRGSDKSVRSVSSSSTSTIFKAQELQLDAFGVYGVGNAPDHAGPFAEHAWGGGLGINYFWTENMGIGVDADAKRGRENRIFGTSRKNFEQFTGSFIYRFPMEQIALAPYGFVGGGVTTDDRNLASAHAGLGVEYRLVPNQIGLFTDARWTYYGDRAGRGDQNNIQIRSGIRFLF